MERDSNLFGGGHLTEVECFDGAIDRIAFALQSSHQAGFIQDIQQVMPEDTPLIFQRSEAAWATHPSNYHQLEQMVMQVGQLSSASRT